MEIISKSCYHKEFINGTRNGSKTWLSTLGDNNLLLLHSPAGMEVSAIHLMSCEVIPRKIRPVENRKLSPIISTHDMSINRGTKQSNYLSFTSATMEDIMSTSSRYENIILTEVLPLQKSSVDNCYVCIFPIAKIIKAKLGPRDDLMKPHAGILKVVFANGMEIALQVDFSSKTPLILASVVSRRDTKNLNYLYTTYQVMFLTLLDMHRSRLLDVSTLIWTHSALCSFSSSMIPKYDSQVLIKLLKNVGRLWSNQAVSHLLTLAAVGHIIACFGPTQKEYLSDKSDQNYDLNSDLWMLCNDVLKSLPSHRLSGEDVKLIESFPVRVALSFLVYLDRTSMIESYTYESFSSVLPLQVHFKLVEVYKLKMLSYATPPPLHTTLSSKVTKTCELISVLAKSDTKMANEFIGLHEKALLVTSTCHSMFDTLAGEVESVKDTCKIWLATKSMLEGRGKISRDDMLRHLSTIVQTPYEFLVSTFDEAFRVWSLYLQLVPYFNKLPANTTLVTGTNKKLIDVANNLELFEKNIEFIQSEFALLHQQQEAMLLFLTNYATSHQASHCKESILQNLPCKISLNEMEFLFHRNKVASFPVEYTFDSFLSIYTDEPFRGSYGFETFVSTLVPLPAPVYEGNDQPVVNNSDVHAVVVIDSHMVRVVNKSIGSVKQVVAGGSVSGCALGPRSLTQLNGPKGFCLIPAACENTMLGLIADTGNHCIRGVILNDRGVFQEEMFSVAGLSRQSGHINGTAGSALFNNPSGMAVVDMMSVLICDYGNHTLRLLRREEVNSNHWVVSTVAGQSTIAGNIDGIADTTALLQLPYQIVTAPTMNQDMEEPYKNFYFTEHGPVHSVRCYRHYPSQPHLSEVITLHKSEPFINLQGLCVDAHGDILVCDSGAGCIWSIDVNTKALTKKITSEFMFEASTALLEKRHIGELKPCTRFMPTTITHMSHVQPGYYLITSQDSPHMLFKYFDTELTSSFRNSLMPLHSEICDGKVTLAQHASTFIQNTSSATNAVSSLVSLVDNVRRSVREALFRRQIILVQNMQVSFANINPSPFNSFFFVCMLANAPDMESLAGLICKLFEETKQSHGRRGGHMGMTGRQRAQAYGLKDDERVGMTNYDDAFDDYDDQPRLGFSGSSGDSDELKGRLIEIMESYNFATLHLDSVMVLQSLFNITKVIGVEKAGNMFQAVLRNQRYTHYNITL